MPAPSGAAGTCRNRPPTRPRCCPRSPPPRSPATPGPGTWSPTRCAASAPPWSRPSTPAATASASSTSPAGPPSPPPTSATPAATARPAPPRSSAATPASSPSLLPPGTAGRAALVITSPPYGSSVHGQVTAEQRRGTSGGVRKYDNHYGDDPANLASRGLDELLDGFTQILAGCRALLRPGGLAVITTRPWREHGELVDLPAAVLAAAARAGLIPAARCVALLAGLRGGQLIARPSFFQLHNLREARGRGEPWHLIVHEDVIIVRNPPAGTEGAGGQAA